MKRIPVTGSAGFIGSHIVEQFQCKCSVIRVLDKLLATGFKPSWDSRRGLEVTVKSYVEALKTGK